MVPARTTYADIGTFFLGTLFMYKGRPSYCLEQDGWNLVIMDMATRKRSAVPFNLADCTSVISRIGMVNVARGVAFIARRPVRRWAMGLSATNCTIKNVIGAGDAPRVAVRTMQVKEIADAIEGKYPSLQQCKKAFEKTELLEGMAFDRQFAVDRTGNVFYRTSRAGKVDLSQDRVENEDIVFKDQPYLQLLLGGKYETDYRTLQC